MISIVLEPHNKEINPGARSAFETLKQATVNKTNEKFPTVEVMSNVTNLLQKIIDGQQEMMRRDEDWRRQQEEKEIRREQREDEWRNKTEEWRELDKAWKTKQEEMLKQLMSKT